MLELCLPELFGKGIMMGQSNERGLNRSVEERKKEGDGKINYFS
jgi:hypothetical protein